MASQSRAVAIALDETALHAVARAIAMRCPDPDVDEARAARMRELVRVTGELSRTLSIYARHALVNCQGTAGTVSLADDTERLAAMLRAFCAEMHSVSREFAERPREHELRAAKDDMDVLENHGRRMTSLHRYAVLSDLPPDGISGAGAHWGHHPGASLGMVP